ncbi:MAG: hypothetical protein ACLGHP_12375, partial [Vicinamibacteria bacterium]
PWSSGSGGPGNSAGERIYRVRGAIRMDERDDPTFLAYLAMLAVVFLAAVTAFPAPAAVADALAGCASSVEALVATAHRFTAEDQVATRAFDVDQWHDRIGQPSGYVATHRLAVLVPGFDQAGDLLTALAAVPPAAGAAPAPSRR